MLVCGSRYHVMMTCRLAVACVVAACLWPPAAWPEDPDSATLEQRIAVLERARSQLLMQYSLADAAAAWPVRRSALQELRLSDDPHWQAAAELCLACGTASFEGDLTAAMERITDLIVTHGDEGTMVMGWWSERGCILSES